MSFQNPKSELFAISVLDKENKYIFCVVRILFYRISKILFKQPSILEVSPFRVVQLALIFAD